VAAERAGRIRAPGVKSSASGRPSPERLPARNVQDRRQRATEDRAAIGVARHPGLNVVKNDAGEKWAFAYLVGGGLGRTPMVWQRDSTAFLPWKTPWLNVSGRHSACL